MNKLFVLHHNIFLTKEERKKLQKQNGVVEVDGRCLPVLLFNNDTTTEPAEEIICTYNISNSETKISDDAERFYFSLDSTHDWKSLLDVKDGGCGILQITKESFMPNKDLQVVHYISLRSKEQYAIC